MCWIRRSNTCHVTKSHDRISATHRAPQSTRHWQRFFDKTRGSTQGGLRHPVTPHPLMSSPLLNETSLGLHLHSRSFAAVSLTELVLTCLPQKVNTEWTLCLGLNKERKKKERKKSTNKDTRWNLKKAMPSALAYIHQLCLSTFLLLQAKDDGASFRANVFCQTDTFWTKTKCSKLKMCAPLKGVNSNPLLLGQCKARPFNFHRVSLFLCFFLTFFLSSDSNLFGSNT